MSAASSSVSTVPSSSLGRVNTKDVLDLGSAIGESAIIKKTALIAGVAIAGATVSATVSGFSQKAVLLGASAGLLVAAFTPPIAKQFSAIGQERDDNMETLASLVDESGKDELVRSIVPRDKVLPLANTILLKNPAPYSHK